MTRKMKRSIILSLVLGDGCLAYNIRKVGKYITGSNQNNLILNPEYGKLRYYGLFTVAHCSAQKDYMIWKANLVSTIFEKDVKVRSTKNGKMFQLAITENRLRAWRKFIYKDGKKDATKIFPFLLNNEFAFSIWLMDCGYVERNDQGIASRLRLFTCSYEEDKQLKIIDWINKTFDITSTKIYYCKKETKKWPYLKINAKDSIKIWSRIREFVLMFDSMKHKFRHIESFFSKVSLQHTAVDKTDDIVRTNSNIG